MREDWIVCKIGDVFNFVGGGTPSTTNENYWNGDIPWASIKDIKGDFLISTINKITQEGLTNSSSNLVAIDEVILATRINPGKPIIAKINTSINQDLKVVKPKVEIPSVFVFYLFKFLEKRIIGLSSGTTVLGIGLNPLKDINFSLPPLPEQRAIVKKLESLFSSLDAGIADLKKAQQQLKIYRQAVLKKAFEGEMNSEKLGEIAEITSSRRIFKDEYVKSGIPFYRTKEIKELSQGLKPAVELFISLSRYEEIKKNNDLPKTNDILISAVGTIGVSYVIRNNEPFYFKDGNLVWIKNPKINSYYLHYYFENKVRFSNSIDTSGSAYNALTIEKLKNFIVTFPENTSQQELVVKQIESRLSVCDSIEQNIKESLEKAEALRQSILKKAFEGNLLTAQELAECKLAEDYEPASILLERIKAEQNKATANTSKKKVTQPLVVAKTETPVAKISADIHAGLIAKVIKIHEENPVSIDNLSHIKCEKIAHLVEYHLQIPLGRQPVKDAAGPDDYPHLKKIEHRAKMANYFAIQKKDIGYSYSSAKNSDKAIEKFQSALSDDKNKKLDDLIALFLKFDLEVSEIIATTYAGWNNLILNGNVNPSDEEIVYESRENWSERKLKIARERFFKAIEWMRKNEIVPAGYGAVVPFPKKKK